MIDFESLAAAMGGLGEDPVKALPEALRAVCPGQGCKLCRRF